MYKIKIFFIFVLTIISVILIYFSFKSEDRYSQYYYDSPPIIVWWTPFTGLINNIRNCNSGSCIFTEDRKHVYGIPTAKAILFYGSEFKIEDLPLPRKHWQWWGLLHEESPKNQPIFNHEASLNLFNLTSTFKQNSGMPLTLQYLQNTDILTSKEYFVPTGKKNILINQGVISPILYLQSDCNPPSERDDYVKEISKFISVDSYGSCLNNRKLPSHLLGIESMNHPELLKLIGKYKFTLSLENYACEDYITEKLWRPLSVGSIPIYWGCPSIERWLPNKKSVIDVRNFESPQFLSSYLLQMLSNDSIYESHLNHKLFGKIENQLLIQTLKNRAWGIHEDQEIKGTFVEAFECYVCDNIINYYNLSEFGTFIADKSHYGCPIPEIVLENSEERQSFWVEQWYKAEAEAQVLHNLVNSFPGTFSMDTYYENVISYLETNNFFKKFKQEL